MHAIKFVLAYSFWVAEGVTRGKLCFVRVSFNVIGWLGQGWEGGSKARSLAFSEIRVGSSETNKKGEVTGGGWVGVSEQLTTSDSYKS